MQRSNSLLVIQIEASSKTSSAFNVSLSTFAAENLSTTKNSEEFTVHIKIYLKFSFQFIVFQFV